MEPKGSFLHSQATNTCPDKNIVYASPSHLLKTYFNIILPYTHTSLFPSGIIQIMLIKKMSSDQLVTPWIRGGICMDVTVKWPT